MRSVFVLFITFMAMVPSVAFAQEEASRTVTVLGLTTTDGDDDVADTITTAIRAAVTNHEGWISSQRNLTLAQTELSRDCPAITSECAQNIAVWLDADGELVIFGVMRRLQQESDDIEISLFLYDREAGRVTNRLSVSETMSGLIVQNRVSNSATDWITRLAGAGTTVPQSEDPVAHASYFEETRTVVASSEPVPPSALDNSAYDIAGWSLIAAAGASAIAAFAVGMQLSDLNGDGRFQAYRESWDSARVTDVCAAAANDRSPEARYALDVCSNASLYEVLVPILWAVAGASAVAGVVLAWHPFASSGETQVALAPIVGPTRAGLDLHIAF